MQFEGFKDIRARRVEITKSSKEELEEYTRQISCYHEKWEDIINVLMRDPAFCYLTVKDEAERQIGIIRIDEIDSKTAQINISIPNVAWKRKYGTEAVHQFLRSCKSQNIYQKIYLKNGNEILTAYDKERPNLHKPGFPIDLAKIA